ncbi:HD domain-containing phosphohydrolase [Maridesulfovibrio frigidus]|uniref:HD domain-containing phosphohydrolase n=1 Tax=Maridesulfovibrio frigidus TaxID=340956 RepID=UPI0004E15D84|nr:HD domain-containing phosphohydrolase [Maridesulfovibrio frigidus]
MSSEINVTLIQLIKSLSIGMDMISTAVTNHHMRVGYLSARIAHKLNFSAEIQRDLLVAGLIHDAGALSLKSRLDALQFEADGIVHSLAGYKLVQPYPKLKMVANYILYHHTSFTEISESTQRIPAESNILNLADRVDVLIKRDQPLAPQIENILSAIKKHSGKLFNPEYVNAFNELTTEPEFIKQTENPIDYLYTLAPEKLENEILLHKELLQYTKLFSQIIDFRSRFTATHSRGVASTAAALAKLMNFSELDQDLMMIAGNLHDLGKLAVPDHIIEKPGPLDDSEWKVMKEHPGHCERILADIPALEKVSNWACNHHERIDGKGYPLQISGKQLSEGCQIMAIADIFTAITEDRPYRKGMSFEQAQDVLMDLADSALDSEIIDTVIRNFDHLNEIRIEAQKAAEKEFFCFHSTE